MSTSLLESADSQPPPREAAPKWCERAVQDAVYVFCRIKNHELIVPNSCVFGWESDVVSVTRTDFAHEFEIKVSRADFKADAKKPRARLLVNPLQKSIYRDYTHPRPNYFWYVTPEGMVTPEEVPDYAGLIYACNPARVDRHGRPHLFYNTICEVKPAARLHKDKLTDKQRRQMTRAITERFWRQRIRQTASVVEDFWN